MLAGQLQRRRVDHLPIEREPAPRYFVKALGVSPRSLEIWEQIVGFDVVTRTAASSLPDRRREQAS